MCGKNCKCEKAGMACTALCQCRGDCEVAYIKTYM